MPEVIEVKLYADYLNSKLRGKNVKEVNILNGKYKKKGPFVLYNKLVKSLPLKVTSVKSKGKLIYFTFENGLFMLNTLGLTGGWMYKTNNKYYHPLMKRYINESKKDRYLERAMNHLNVEMKTDVGSAIFYDMLSYGTLKIIDNQMELNKKLTELGPDIMDANTTFPIFKSNIRKKANENKEIGNVIVNQKIISGIGNYLRADALWLSKISPFRKVKDVIDLELKRIYSSVRFLVWSEYDYNNGISLGIIKKNQKRPVDYGRDFFVYDNENDIYNNEIIKEELFEGSQKRFIFWVPKLQK